MIHLIVKFLIAWVVRKITSMVTGKAPVVLGWGEYLKNIAPVGRSPLLSLSLSLSLTSLHRHHYVNSYCH